jgi:hypothetical protein
MGCEWSCPCGERTEIKRRVFINPEADPAESSVDNLLVAIKSIYPAKLKSKLKAPTGEYILSSMAKHPLLDKCILVSLLESELDYKYTKSGKFHVFAHKYSNVQSLQSEIESKYKNGYVFIGGYYTKKNIMLVFFETKSKSDTQITIKPQNDLSLKTLKSIFQEQSDKIYLGSIKYKESVLLVFQQSTNKPFKYFVSEYPNGDIENGNFETNLAYKISECMLKKDVQFRAFVTYDTSLFLIFIQDF